MNQETVGNSFAARGEALLQVTQADADDVEQVARKAIRVSRFVRQVETVLAPRLVEK